MCTMEYMLYYSAKGVENCALIVVTRLSGKSQSLYDLGDASWTISYQTLSDK